MTKRHPSVDQPPAARLSRDGPTMRSFQNGLGRLLWVIVPLVYAVIGWSLVGDRLVSARAQQTIEIGGIGIIGIVALLLALYTKSSNSRIERAYSGHLEELSERLRSLAYQDSLTGLHNHRYFYEQLRHEVERAHRYGRPVSLILLDLDRFKEVNDTYGHLMGDKVLALMGELIRAQIRGADVAARYGGDEFAIILPDTPRQAADAVAYKLTEAIAADRTHVGHLTENLRLSASFGVSSCPDEAKSVSELLQIADSRLYASKGFKSQPPSVAAPSA